MRLTKHTHACIDVEHEGRHIVIDPGAFTASARELLARADAVLVTHSHVDHLDTAAVADAMRAREGLVLFGPADAVEPLRAEFGERARAVTPGEELGVEGVTVAVYGRAHAEVLAAIPLPPCVGYLLGGSVFHPGDSFAVPDVEVDTLLVPVSGPWMKLADAAQFVDDVRPRRAIAIHEVMLSRVGLDMYTRVLGTGSGRPVAIEFLDAGAEF